MIHPFNAVGTSCLICKRTIELLDFGDIPPYTFCSEFCASTTEAEKQKYLNAQPGNFVVYPCSDCGMGIEDEWDPNGRHLCSECGPKRQLRVRTAQLKELSEFLKVLLPEIPSDLLPKIESMSKAIENALQDYPEKIVILK